ncbi:low density lipoprotein receptor adapter protein 1 isoform X2 [Hemitrygon akajei]
MALSNLPFLDTLRNSPAILRQRLQRGRARSLSHGDPAFTVHYAGTEQIYSLGLEQASEVVQRLVGPGPGPAGAGRACKDHVLVVRPRYLEVKDIASGRQLTKTYLHDVAYCGPDREQPSVFLYICKHRKQLQCRVFRCNREEKVRAITVCLAQVFEAAFRQWRAACSEEPPPLPLPALPPDAQPEPGTAALGAGSPQCGDGEEDHTLDSDEEVEQRMHREFLRRATSFRAPEWLDTGYGDLEELTAVSLVQELVEDEQQED